VVVRAFAELSGTPEKCGQRGDLRGMTDTDSGMLPA